jgi:hypothetical protein
MTGFTRDGSVCKITFDADAVYMDEDVLGDVAFEVLNADGKWVTAQARIEGGTLWVWNDGVIVPQGVRYAWANYPKACLFNQDGLPVLPFNTTKDLNTPVPAGAFATNAHYLKKAYHLLDTGDAIINLTRNGAFRYVSAVNAYVVAYTNGAIEGQAPGDQIILLKRQGSFVCESGTTETIVKIPGHGLNAGDWIRNTKSGILTEVLEVIDENTVRVGPVAGQSAGDVFEVFRNAGTITAEG